MLGEVVIRSLLNDCLYVCVCVQNMVGPGEVDDELEGETAEECSKYGKVVKCLIFEVSVILQRFFGLFQMSFRSWYSELQRIR